jgi:type VI secretion system protein ImpA
MVATGEAPPREDETAPDRGSIDRAFGEAELDTLKSTAADLRRILDAADTIQVTSIEHAGYEQAVSFDKLPALIKKMLESVDTAVAARDPSAAAALSSTALGEADTNGSPAAAPPVAVTSTVPSGRIATMADARDALAALNGYFRVSEPSSPAAILVQQAQRLMGKSFPEVVRILVPALADQAKIQIGSEKLFGLTFDQFPDPQEAWSGAGADEPGADDGWSSSSWSEDAQVASEPERSDADASQPAIQATTRADAVSLLDQVSSFYRRAEPSSPIPLLTERARGMIERDFLAILKDVLPGLMSSRDD